MNKASRVKVKMKTVSPNIMIGCLLAAFVPCVISATIPSNSDREMKLNVALQKRDQYVPKRSLDNSVELLDEKENKNMGTPISPDSDHLSGRGKGPAICLPAQYMIWPTASVSSVIKRIMPPTTVSVPVATAGDGGVPSFNALLLKPMERAL